MGTTYDALIADFGIATEIVIAIEGYSYLLTTAVAPSEAVTAWSGTDWTAALGGLAVKWDLRQKLDPWKPFDDGPTLGFSVMDCDGTDRFGIDVHRKEGGTSSKLAAALALNNGASMTLASTTGLSAPGTVHVGTEAIGFATVTSSTVLSTLTRAKWSPLETQDGDPWRPLHSISQSVPGVNPVETPGTNVRTIPTEWAGRWVEVWIHRRVREGLLDVKAEAHRAFVGRIAEIRDGSDGQTHVTCDDARKTVTEAVIFREPFRAHAGDSFYIQPNTTFTIRDRRTTALGITTAKVGNPLVFAAGVLYNGQKLEGEINNWLADEKAASRTVLKNEYRFASQVHNLLPTLRYEDPGDSTSARQAWLQCSDPKLRDALGWPPDGLIVNGSGSEFTGVGARPPVRVSISLPMGATAEFPITAVQGEYVDQEAFLPSLLKLDSTGIVKIGDGYFLCESPSATISAAGTIIIKRSADLDRMLGAGTDPNQPFTVSLAVDQPGHVEVTQVLIIEGLFRVVLQALLFSTGLSGWNNLYDLLPAHCSALVPYSVFGAAFESELDRIAAGGTDRLTCVIEKPTRLVDLLNVSFTLRRIQLVWRTGRLALRGWATPTSSATLTFGESNKAVPVGQRDAQRAVTEQSTEWMRNVIKIRVNRTLLEDTYRDTITIIDKGSEEVHGSKSVQLDARNACRGYGTRGEDIEGLLGHFAGALPFLTRPAYLVRVPMDMNCFETHTPGEVLLFSDSFARDPTSGERIISSKPALIVGAHYDWGGGENGVGAPGRRPPSGELDLMLFPQLSLAAYCPSAQVDDTVGSGGFSAGYNSGTNTLRVYAHACSESADAVDRSHFVAGNLIRIVEIDPAVAGSPTVWDRTILSVSGNDITLTSGLSSPAWDPALKYRLFSQPYSVAQTSQQAKTYQADNADRLIENLRAPYGYAYFGAGQDWGGAESSAADLPRRHSIYAFGDGAPLDTGNAQDACNNANNLIHYKTAVQTPVMYSDETAPVLTPAVYELCRVEWVWLGNGRLQEPGKTRRLYMRPIHRSSDGSTATMRVTLSRTPPRSTTDPPSREGVTFVNPYLQTSWATTSTSNVRGSLDSLRTHFLDLGTGYLAGGGWLCVELTDKARFVGWATLYLGPVEDE